MKLQEAREIYYFHTGKASDITRQLALGAVAIVWLFRTGTGASVGLPAGLVLPLILVVVALILDLLQYVAGAIFWGAFQWRREKRGTLEEEEFKAPNAINWPAISFFWSKIAVLGYAYCVLFNYLKAVLYTTA